MGLAYEKYIKSKHWAALKGEKAKLARKRCAICYLHCGHIDCHHLRYGNLYDVKVTDLVWLCRECHSIAHKLQEDGRLKKYETLSSEDRYKETRRMVMHVRHLTEEAIESAKNASRSVIGDTTPRRAPKLKKPPEMCKKCERRIGECVCVSWE